MQLVVRCIDQPTYINLGSQDQKRGQGLRQLPFTFPQFSFPHPLHHLFNMSWDRYELGQKNIFYDEEIHFIGKVLPPHVVRVRRCMLDFSCPIRGHKELFDAVSSDGQIKRPSDGSDIDPALKAASNAFNKATSIVNGGYLEKKWENFFETHFFEPLSDSLSVSKDDSRR